MKKTTLLVSLALTVIGVPEASARHPDSRIASIKCTPRPGSEQAHDTYATLIYEQDGKNLVRIEVQHPCWYDDIPVIVWWRYKGGTAAVWVDPADFAELSKSQLKKLPVQTKDGKVHFVMDNDDDPYTFNWRASGNRVYGPWPGTYA
jgi:hypothetical protein